MRAPADAELQDSGAKALDTEASTDAPNHTPIDASTDVEGDGSSEAAAPINCETLDCGDDKTCAYAVCVPDKGCAWIPKPGDCPDDDPCTSDMCEGLDCVHKPVANCKPAACSDADYFDSLVAGQFVGEPVGVTATTDGIFVFGDRAARFSHGGMLQSWSKPHGHHATFACHRGKTTLVVGGKAVSTSKSLWTVPWHGAVTRYDSGEPVWTRTHKPTWSPVWLPSSPTQVNEHLNACAPLPNGRWLVTGQAGPTYYAKSKAHRDVGRLHRLNKQGLLEASHEIADISGGVLGYKGLGTFRTFDAVPVAGEVWLFGRTRLASCDEESDVFHARIPLSLKPQDLFAGCTAASHFRKDILAATVHSGRLWYAILRGEYWQPDGGGDVRIISAPPKLNEQLHYWHKPGFWVGKSFAPAKLVPHGTGRTAAVAGRRFVGSFDRWSRRVVPPRGKTLTAWVTAAALSNERILLVGHLSTYKQGQITVNAVHLKVLDAWGFGSCNEAGLCAGMSAASCDDGDDATVDLCQADKGCLNIKTK